MFLLKIPIVSSVWLRSLASFGQSRAACGPGQCTTKWTNSSRCATMQLDRCCKTASVQSCTPGCRCPLHVIDRAHIMQLVMARNATSLQEAYRPFSRSSFEHLRMASSASRIVMLAACFQVFAYFDPIMPFFSWVQRAPMQSSCPVATA